MLTNKYEPGFAKNSTQLETLAPVYLYDNMNNMSEIPVPEFRQCFRNLIGR